MFINFVKKPLYLIAIDYIAGCGSKQHSISTAVARHQAAPF
jgi:hypothetical protein